eukprot:g82653.t1
MRSRVINMYNYIRGHHRKITTQRCQACTVNNENLHSLNCLVDDRCQKDRKNYATENFKDASDSSNHRKLGPWIGNEATQHP